MPLTDMSGMIASRTQALGQQAFVQVDKILSPVNPDDPGAIVVAPGQEHGARRRAYWSDIEIVELRRLTAEEIHCWSGRPEPVSVSNPQVIPSLIVSLDDQDIWRRSPSEKTAGKPEREEPQATATSQEQSGESVVHKD